MRASRHVLLLMVLSLVAAGIFAQDSPLDVAVADHAALPAVEILNKPYDASHVQLAMHDNEFAYHVTWRDGTEQWLAPEAYAKILYRDDAGRPWWKRVLNITAPLGMVWVGLGLGGQLLFTGRMIVQWLVSEREQRSTVPPAFWWLSIIGASMLIVYFAWRKDIVGIGGQAAGWLIYVRNLRMIYSGKYGRKTTTPSDADTNDNALS